MIAILAAGGCLYAMFRFQHMRDLLAMEISQAKTKAEAANATAEAARAKAETIEVSHFNTVRARVESLSVEVAGFQKAVDGLRETHENFQQKWAVRIGREVKKAQQEAAEAAAIEAGNLFEQPQIQPGVNAPNGGARPVLNSPFKKQRWGS